MPSQPPPAPSEPALGELVLQVARGLRRRFAATLEPGGVTPHEFRALRVIGAHEPTRLGVVAQHLRIAPRSVTDVVDSLEARGFVVREPDPSDRRATRVVLRPRGRDVLDQLDAARRADHESYFADLAEGDRATLARILGRLVDEA